MNLFYVPVENISGELAHFPEDEARHAVNVLRYSKGDEIRFTDGEGRAYSATVDQTGKKTLQARITGKHEIAPSSAPVTIALGYIRQKQRLEFAIEKLVELGVDHIAVFHGDHSEPGRAKADRMEKIIRAASKQSLRYNFPGYSEHDSLEALIRNMPPGLLIAAHEKATVEDNFTADLSGNIVTGLIGPEGGLSDREVEMITACNGRIISLGERRLRAETAAIVLATLFKYNLCS